MAVFGFSLGSIENGPKKRFTKVLLYTRMAASPNFARASGSVSPIVPMGGWEKTTVGTSA